MNDDTPGRTSSYSLRDQREGYYQKIARKKKRENTDTKIRTEKGTVAESGACLPDWFPFLRLKFIIFNSVVYFINEFYVLFYSHFYFLFVFAFLCCVQNLDLINLFVCFLCLREEYLSHQRVCACVFLTVCECTFQKR